MAALAILEGRHDDPPLQVRRRLRCRQRSEQPDQQRCAAQLCGTRRAAGEVATERTGRFGVQLIEQELVDQGARGRAGGRQGEIVRRHKRLKTPPASKVAAHDSTPAETFVGLGISSSPIALAISRPGAEPLPKSGSMLARASN